MGRRKGFIATMFSEMEKANQRAAAEQRRTQRLVQTAYMRAIERETVREERAADRERIRLERDAERRKLEIEKERSAHTKQAEKQAAKQAQLRAWTLEYEACQERETDIDRIGNDAPEVEDRDEMYAALAVRRVFVPDAFVPPPPHRSYDEANAIQSHSASGLEATMAAFRPDLLTLRRVQLGAAILGVSGIVLIACSVAGIGAALMVSGFVGVAVLQKVTEHSRRRQHLRFSQRTQEHYDAWSREQMMALERRDAQQSEAMLQNAWAEHGLHTDYARRSFDDAESQRLDGLKRLHDGHGSRMKEVLEEALELDLPVPCPAHFTIESTSAISIDIDLPSIECLPKDEAKQQASGKVGYKAKPEKRLREQYMRLIAGVAIRYASEAMLYLPSCDHVHVRMMLTDINPATGTRERRCVLDVAYDYKTLAPMTMDGIDPVLALEHFQHQVSLTRGRELRRAQA